MLIILIIQNNLQENIEVIENFLKNIVKIINIIGEEEIKKELMQLPLYSILNEITGIGEYKYYNGFKIMKN